jgi:Protein of unknown function (DUF3253)
VSGAGPTDEAIADAIVALTAARDPGRTICPSEAARALAGENGRWRELMPSVRRVAGALAEHGALRVSQRGREVDAAAVRGPIRVSRP